MDIEENGTEQHQTLEQEEQIMIMIDGLEDNEEDQDLLEQLVAEPPCQKKRSSNYDYLPAPHQPQRTEEGESIELKTSSTSTATSGDVELPVRRCLCEKTRCLKNYCECFKQGLACTSDCLCLACGNQERLFLTSSNSGVTKCRCLKSHCLKKYCECHSSGKKCGQACKCFDCHNTEEEAMEDEMEDEMEEEKPETTDIDHLLFLHRKCDI